MSARYLGVLVAAVALSGGCLDMIEPDVGPPTSEICRNEDSDPDTDVSYSIDIAEGIFSQLCFDCHHPQGATPLGIEVAGLDLSSYASLRRGGTTSGANIVAEGMPCDSVLWQKLAAGPPFGSRMPLSGPPFLSLQERRLISDWIAEGARDN